MKARIHPVSQPLFHLIKHSGGCQNLAGANGLCARLRFSTHDSFHFFKGPPFGLSIKSGLAEPVPDLKVETLVLALVQIRRSGRADLPRGSVLVAAEEVAADRRQFRDF